MERNIHVEARNPDVQRKYQKKLLVYLRLLLVSVLLAASALAFGAFQLFALTRELTKADLPGLSQSLLRLSQQAETSLSEDLPQLLDGLSALDYQGLSQAIDGFSRIDYAALAQSVKKLEEIDYQALCDSIAALNSIVAPLGRFFGVP